MLTKQLPKLLSVFEFEGKTQSVAFGSTMTVTTGVSCDVYTFSEDKTKDLGIIRIDPGCKTPLQKVLRGERTIEGFISGKGKLVITKKNGEIKIYEVGYEKSPKFSPVIVEIGEQMQWQADKDNRLIAYEVCFPPYQDGRYENVAY